MTALESGSAMKAALIALALLAAAPAAAEVANAPDLKHDAAAAAAARRDILCHGPATLVASAKAAKRLADAISPHVPGPVVMLAGASSVVVEADAAALARLLAASEVRSLHRIGGVRGTVAKPSVESLRARAEQQGGAQVIAALAVDIPTGADDATRRAAIAGASAALLAALAPAAPTNVKTFDVSPVVALTVDRKGLDALLASSNICSVSEDAMSQPLMGGGIGGPR